MQIPNLKTLLLLVAHRLYVAFRKQLRCRKDVCGAGSWESVVYCHNEKSDYFAHLESDSGNRYM